MKKILGCFFVCSFLFGCTSGTGEDGDDTDDELIGAAEDALLSQNSVVPNAVAPNAVAPNAVAPNAVAPNALTPGSVALGVMTALRDPGEAGYLSRMHVKYLVSCAFDSAHSFQVSWTDAQQVTHDETYWGALALAPEWATRGITETEQRWISACMGARTNYYGTSVFISMRGGHASLATYEEEQIDYPMHEGAFVGNIFAETPSLKACYNADNVEHSRSKLRDCATGHFDGTETVDCGIIDVVGPCSDFCTEGVNPVKDGFASCDGSAQAITTYLSL